MKVTATVRMYRLHELGDCFVIAFSAGGASSHVLVDCGSFRNSGKSQARLDAIVRAIKADLGGARLDVVVGTHQHNDHLNGFLHCTPGFRAIGVDEVWLSWLDDPADPQARRIGRDFHNLRLQLAGARDALSAPNRPRALSGPGARTVVGVMNDVLGFFGAAEANLPPDVPARAVGVLRTLGRQAPRYLSPGSSLDVPGLPAGAVRVHVLGPPRRAAELFRKNPRQGESYDPHLAAASAMASRYFSAIAPRAADARDEQHFPFNDRLKRRRPLSGPRALQRLARRYARGADRWRGIDDAWLDQGEALALYLDTFTNNSSLVLAFELVESGKVLLFAADAQAGNWASWKDVRWTRDDVTTDSLLARTVFYKVGHHASHNATLVPLFEKVVHEDLVALIPVHKRDPNIRRKGGWRMPARNLFRRLAEKTHGRVLQMDGANPPHCRPTAPPAKAAWERVGIRPRISRTSIALDIEG
jgi:hypothetical protein